MIVLILRNYSHNTLRCIHQPAQNHKLTHGQGSRVEHLQNSHVFSQKCEFSHIFDNFFLFNLSGPAKIIIAIRKPGGGQSGINKNKQCRKTRRKEFGMLYARIPEGGPVRIRQGHGPRTARGRQGGGFTPVHLPSHPLWHGHDQKLITKKHRLLTCHTCMNPASERKRCMFDMCRSTCQLL